MGRKAVKKEFLVLTLDEIIPYANNPRVNDDAVDDVAESIRQCGNCDPIEVDEDNIILSGHTRYKALKQLGYTETEVIRYTGMSEAKKRKYRILTNKTHEKATWDIEMLPEELEGLDFEGYDFDFDVFDMEDIEETDSYNSDTSDNPFFTVSLTFPADKKDKIMAYLRLNRADIIQRIIDEAG